MMMHDDDEDDDDDDDDDDYSHRCDYYIINYTHKLK